MFMGNIPNTMKPIFTFLLVLAGLHSVNAQVRFFANFGLQSSHAGEKNASPDWDTAFKPFFTNRNSLHLGIGTEIPLSNNNRWYLHSVLRFSGKGRNFYRVRSETQAQTTDTLSSKYNVVLNYMELPVSLLYKKTLKEGLYIHAGAGLYGAFLFNGKIHNETRIYSSKKYTKDDFSVETGNAPEKYKTSDMGYVLSMGVEKGRLGLQVFVENGLTSFYQKPGIESIRHKVMGLSLNYFLASAIEIVEPDKDRDQDGVMDPQDACPLEPGASLTSGCPDTDGDGIADKTDKCPQLKGLPRYQGCPIPDSDQDGIDDENDACPSVKGLPKHKGCPPPDRDKDGLEDEFDQCPDLAGSLLNKGCPVLTDTIRKKFETIAAQIFFSYKSDSLMASSLKALEELSNILLQNSQLVLKIEGHTDNAGNSGSNLNLSQHRADAVKLFFIQKGIAESRLTAIGWGQEKPKASNDTVEGRQLNRRVELLVEEKQ